MESRPVLDIHRLRVLNFDIIDERKPKRKQSKSEVKLEVESQTKTKRFEQIKNNHNSYNQNRNVENVRESVNIENNNNKENIHEVENLHNTLRKENTSISGTSVHKSGRSQTSGRRKQSSKRRGNTIKLNQSNNNILEILSKRNFKKRRTREKMIDVDEIKRKLSEHSFTCSSRIAKTIKTLSKESALERKRKLKLSQKNKASELEDKSDVLKVLFTRNRSKFKQEHTIPKNKRKKRRIRTPHDGKKNFPLPALSLDDVFGFRNSKKFVNPVVYRQSLSVLGLRKCSRTKPAKQAQSCGHLKLLSSPCGKSSHIFYKFPIQNCPVTSSLKQNSAIHLQNTPLEYNLKECTEKFRPKSHNSHEKYGRQRMDLASCVDCSTKRSACADCPIIPNHSYLSKARQNDTLTHICVLNEPPKLRKHDHQAHVCMYIDNNNKLETKDCARIGSTEILKCILFGLVLIVFLPCIFVAFICWFIAYSLRPFSRKCVESDGEVHLNDCDQEKGFFSNFVKWIKSAKAQKTEGDDPFYRCKAIKRKSNRGPDPNRQYLLYYDNRGWVVKPQKKACTCLPNNELPHFPRPKSRQCTTISNLPDQYMPCQFRTCDKCLEKYHKQKKKKCKVVEQQNNKKTSEIRFDPTIKIDGKNIKVPSTTIQDVKETSKIKFGPTLKVGRKTIKGPTITLEQNPVAGSKKCCLYPTIKLEQRPRKCEKRPVIEDNICCKGRFRRCFNDFKDTLMADLIDDNCEICDIPESRCFEQKVSCFTCLCCICKSLLHLILVILAILVWLPAFYCFQCCVNMFVRC